MFRNAGYRGRGRCVRPLICGLLLGVTGPSSAGDINHGIAVRAARRAVPTGVAVEGDDERFDPLMADETYEVELVIRNGKRIADVEVDRKTGEVLTMTEIVQTAAQRTRWQQIMNLSDGDQLDFRNAHRKAWMLYPDAAIKEIDLDIEDGRLQYDVKMRDMMGDFEIEIDAITGALSNVDSRGITFAEAATIARSQDSAATLINMELFKQNARWQYEAILTKRRGLREVNVKIDALSGRVLSSNMRVTPTRKIADYRTKSQLASAALFDYTDALQITREGLGGGRPLRIGMVVRNGVLYYKSIFRFAAVRESQFVNAVTGEDS